MFILYKYLINELFLNFASKIHLKSTKFWNFSIAFFSYYIYTLENPALIRPAKRFLLTNKTKNY